ncbi:glycosyltransferase family 25 protein [Thioclava electrotropha]|uniref:Glycosyltransferase family 25 protein n=1 Tax=Thioclava electrotropha TaxID=1549850 RepID=A0ABX6YR02_9RHOB|nr:glycosyltransferase family 25 protein [Thioclava electrotropha]QPZ89700.1 glycosyltransferase family 25 protein [Thioclava electrotropha]
MSTANEPDWPILVISLQDAAERRAMVSKQLEALGLSFKFFDAIDGRSGLPAAYENQVDRPGTELYFGRPMSDGEYACALSHLAVYRKIMEENLPGAIILEDDAIIGSAFALFLKEKGYEHAPLIQLDHLNARVRRVGATSTKLESCELWHLYRNAFLTTGYAINQQAASFILEQALPLRCPADWPCDLRPLGPYCTVPRLVDHPTAEQVPSSLGVTRNTLAKRQKRNLKYGWKYLESSYWKKKWLKITARRLS